MMVDAVQRRRGEEAGLAHRAAEHAAMPRRRGDESARAGQQRAARGAQPLRERDRDQIERRRQLAPRDRPLATLAFHSRAPSRKVARPRSCARAQMRTTSAWREDDAAGPVVGVLDLEQRASADTPAEPRGLIAAAAASSEKTPAAPISCNCTPQLRRRAARLVPGRVAFAADHHLVARPRQHAQGDLVRHRARGQPERCLLAEQLGQAVLQAIGERVFAVLIVAHRCACHGFAHRRCRPGDGVGAQVDRVVGVHACSRDGMGGSAGVPGSAAARSVTMARRPRSPGPGSRRSSPPRSSA